MYTWDFSRSDGAGRATTRNTRGLTRSVMALIVPPLPAASRPSNTTTTRRPFSLTQLCNAHNSTWSLRSSSSYSLRFINVPRSVDWFRVTLCGAGRIVRGHVQRFGQMPGMVKSALGPRQQLEFSASGLGRCALQGDILQQLCSAGISLVAKLLRGRFERAEDRWIGQCLRIL